MSSFQTTESLLIEANTLFVDDNFEEALVKYNKAVDLEPDNVDAYVKRSSCHYRLKNFAGMVLRNAAVTHNVSQRVGRHDCLEAQPQEC